MFVVKLINAVLDALCEAFFEGAARPVPVKIKVRK